MITQTVLCTPQHLIRWYFQLYKSVLVEFSQHPLLNINVNFAFSQKLEEEKEYMKTLKSLTQMQRRVHWWPRWEQESGRRLQSVEPSWSSHCRRICFFQEKPPIFSWELISFSYGETPWETKSCVCWSDCIHSLSWAHYHLQESSRKSKMWGEPHQKYIQIYMCKYSSDQASPLHQPQLIKKANKMMKSLLLD